MFLLAIFGVLTTLFFVQPETGPTAHANAVVVLAGYNEHQRTQRGEVLARQQQVPILAASSQGQWGCPPASSAYRVICFSPDPKTTQGEARAIGRLARQYHWHAIDVVAGTTQVSRARVRIGRCYHGQLGMSGVDPRGVWGWVHYLAYDWAATAKAFTLQRTC